MTAESGADSHNEQPDRHESPYLDDAMGDLCDQWVRSGDRFVVREDGGYGRESILAAELQDEFTMPFNPALVSEVSDRDGRPIKCVAIRDYAGFDHRSYKPRAPLERLMMELPPEALVYTKRRDRRSKYPHPAGIDPFGIRLTEVPQVRKLVAQAYTAIPKGNGRYPADDLVLYPGDQRDYLRFFDAVLSPPKPEPPPEVVAPLPQPSATTPVTPRPAIVPTSAAAPATPPQQRTVSTPPAGRPEAPQPPPSAFVDYFQLGSKAVSYVSTFLAGTFVSDALWHHDLYGGSYPSEYKRDIVLAVCFGALAVLGYVGSRVEK